MPKPQHTQIPSNPQSHKEKTQRQPVYRSIPKTHSQPLPASPAKIFEPNRQVCQMR
ncbi:hypothetical protein [Candidatus Bathycorpusculum sp.]|uniref:hypothetical protein n=1 Tax=Candidatus Bathycorpusculum sp. TaxID=2994959 RepID=UPI0028274414|nr:hypothetical protein [Candidatus Termitimicrobium sp.]MCL2686652.1 hypothetical protein [Candidatus Termitimicrobium sp.]